MSPPPHVVTWFKVYAGVLTLTYVAAVGFGLFMLFGLEDPDPAERIPMIFGGAAMVLLGLLFAAASGAALFLPPRPWVWTYDLVLICVGMTSCCFLPFSVVLLVFWIKPETKAHFGRP